MGRTHTPRRGKESMHSHLAAHRTRRTAVISNAARVAAGDAARRKFGTDCFVHADGFQHLRLQRAVNVVTMATTNAWSGGKLLRYGRLREPLSGLSRAA